MISELFSTPFRSSSTRLIALQTSMASLLRKPPPLLVPGSASSSLRLAAQTPFDPSSSTEPPYVLHAVPFSQGYLFAGSDDSIRAFSPTLQPLGKLPSTQKGITSLAPGSGKGSNVAFVTARDGTVAGWDLRDLTKEAFKVRGQLIPTNSCLERVEQADQIGLESSPGKSGAPYLCASQSSDQSCLAVGTEVFHYEAMIDFWFVSVRILSSANAAVYLEITDCNDLASRDLRTMQLQHTYTESHSDDITSLSFHPSPALPHVLLSGSVDGVLNTYDVRISDEDDAVQSTLQVGASIVDAGWMPLPGQSSEMTGVWGTTTIETLQLWDANEVSSIPPSHVNEERHCLT